MLCLIDGGFTIQDGGAVSSGSLDDDGVVALDGVGSIATTGTITVGASQPGFLAIQNGAVLTSDGVTFVGGISRDQLGPVDGAGSEWNNDLDQARLTIGFGNPATLTISNGERSRLFCLESVLMTARRVL
jgi:T5SS/PEP-CTERM-associated repeat protein